MKYVVTTRSIFNKLKIKEFDNIVLATVYLHNEFIKRRVLSGTIHREDKDNIIAICVMKKIDGEIQVIV